MHYLDPQQDNWVGERDVIGSDHGLSICVDGSSLMAQQSLHHITVTEDLPVSIVTPSST